MNETSASVPRADRKHTPRLTWRAWVARAILGVFSIAAICIPVYGAWSFYAAGCELSRMTGFGMVCWMVCICAAFLLAWYCIWFVENHINERK